MFFTTEVTKWVDNRDSKLRVDAHNIHEHGYKLYVLNPNRISDLKVHGTGSSFLFSDNHRDRREGNSYIECNSTVAEIETAHNTAFHSKFITFPFCPKNDPTRPTVDVTLDESDCAYFTKYDAPHEIGVNEHDFCWLIYNKKAFKRVEQLVHYSLEDVPDVALTGTTTSTTTTTLARTEQ